MNVVKAVSLATATVAVILCICVAIADSSASSDDMMSSDEMSIESDVSSDDSVAESTVAKIGNDEYETLKAAFDAIASMGNNPITVELVADCTVDNLITVSSGKNVILNLNGHIVTANVNGVRLFEVESSSFTVDGTVAGSGITVKEGNTEVYGFIIITEDSEVTLVGGNYTGSTYKGAFVKILDEAPNSVVTIKDAYMTTDSWIFDTEYLRPSKQTATLTVIGGEYKSTTTATKDDGRTFCIKGTENVTARFEGATISSTVGPGVMINDSAYADLREPQMTAYITNCNIVVTGSGDSFCNTAVAVSKEANVIIDGGTYKGERGYGAYIYTSGGALTINDGTFSGGTAAVAADVDRGSYPGVNAIVSFKSGITDGNWAIGNHDGVYVTITGGTHSANIGKYCPEGYKITQTGGSYVVNVDLDLSISVENNRRGETMLQAVPSTAATLDETRTVAEWAFEGRHYSDEAKIIPTKSGLYAVTVTVYDEDGTRGTATAEYQFDYVHTVTLKLPDGTEKTFTVAHNGTIANLPTPGKLHYSYLWTDADGSEFKATDKVNRDLTLTATLVMSDISVDISYLREDGKVYVKATCSPAVTVEGIVCTWAIDGGEPVAVDRVELTEKDRHYRFEMNGMTSDGTLARAVWEDDLCKTTDAGMTIETDREKVSIVPADTSKTAIDQTIDFNMPDIAEDEKVTISIKGTITDTRSTVDVSVEDITNSGHSWTGGMSAAVDVSVRNVDSGYSLAIVVKVQIPDDYLGAVAYFYNESRGCLERVDSTIDEATGLVTIYTDHNTPYVVQVLTKENPDPVVPDTPDVPIYDDDDDYYPVYPTVTDSGKKDDSKAAVACAAAGVVAALMAAYLVTDSRKSR